MEYSFLFCASIVFFMGLCMGSFMNVLVYRVPRNKSIVTPPSSCPQCGYRIKWYSNIPVLSYLFQGGKCKNCGVKISWMYPLVEFTTGVLFLAVFLKFGLTVLSIKYISFVFILLAAAFTDLFTSFDKDDFECGMIPDVYTVGGVMVGYLWSLSYGEVSFIMSLAGSGAGAFMLLIVSFLFQLIRNKEGIGMGDVLLMGMVGSFLGPESILFVVTLGAIVGSIIGGISIVLTKNRDYMMPFGPMLAFGSVVYVFAGDMINRLLFS